MADYNSRHKGADVDNAVDGVVYPKIEADLSTTPYNSFEKYKNRVKSLVDGTAIPTPSNVVPTSVKAGVAGSIGTSSQYALADHVHGFEGQSVKQLYVYEALGYWKFIDHVTGNYFILNKKGNTTVQGYKIGSASFKAEPDTKALVTVLKNTFGLSETAENVIYGFDFPHPTIKETGTEFNLDGIVKVVCRISGGVSTNIDVKSLRRGSSVPVSVFIYQTSYYVAIWDRYADGSTTDFDHYLIMFERGSDGLPTNIKGVRSDKSDYSNGVVLDLIDPTLWSFDVYDTSPVSDAYNGMLSKLVTLLNSKLSLSVDSIAINYSQYVKFTPIVFDGLQFNGVAREYGNQITVSRGDHQHPYYANKSDFDKLQTSFDDINKRAIKAVIDSVVVTHSGDITNFYKISKNNNGYKFDGSVIMFNASTPSDFKIMEDSGGSLSIVSNLSAKQRYYKEYFGVQNPIQICSRIMMSKIPDICNQLISNSGSTESVVRQFRQDLDQSKHDLVIDSTFYIQDGKFNFIAHSCRSYNYKECHPNDYSAVMAFIHFDGGGGDMTTQYDRIRRGELTTEIGVYVKSNGVLIMTDKVIKLESSDLNTIKTMTNSGYTLRYDRWRGLPFMAKNAADIRYVGSDLKPSDEGMAAEHGSLSYRGNYYSPSDQEGINRYLMRQPMIDKRRFAVLCEYNWNTGCWHNRIDYVNMSYNTTDNHNHPSVSDYMIDSYGSLIPQYSRMWAINNTGNHVLDPIKMHYLHLRFQKLQIGNTGEYNGFMGEQSLLVIGGQCFRFQIYGNDYYTDMNGNAVVISQLIPINAVITVTAHGGVSAHQRCVHITNMITQIMNGRNYLLVGIGQNGHVIGNFDGIDSDHSISHYTITGLFCSPLV